MMRFAYKGMPALPQRKRPVQTGLGLQLKKMPDRQQPGSSLISFGGELFVKE